MNTHLAESALFSPELQRSGEGRWAGRDDRYVDDGALYDEARGPRDPHGRTLQLPWPPDERWTPPATVFVEFDQVIAPDVIADREPPPGYRWAGTHPGSGRVHLVAVADLAIPRADGRAALCGAIDNVDMPNPAGLTVCPRCHSEAHT